MTERKNYCSKFNNEYREEWRKGSERAIRVDIAVMRTFERVVEIVRIPRRHTLRIRPEHDFRGRTATQP